MNVGKINNTLELCGLQKDTCTGKFCRVLDEKNHERMPRYGGKAPGRYIPEDTIMAKNQVQ